VKHQTAGFLLSADGVSVALIRKRRPAWMLNLWNGIGGKAKKGETPLETQRREFREETGVDIVDWQQFALYHSAHGTEIHWFVAASDDVFKVKSKTDEKVRIFPAGKIPLNTIPNIAFLLDMAFQVWMCSAAGFEVRERGFCDGNERRTSTK